MSMSPASHYVEHPMISHEESGLDQGGPDSPLALRAEIARLHEALARLNANGAIEEAKTERGWALDNSIKPNHLAFNDGGLSRASGHKAEDATLGSERRDVGESDLISPALSPYDSRRTSATDSESHSLSSINSTSYSPYSTDNSRRSSGKDEAESQAKSVNEVSYASSVTRSLSEASLASAGDYEILFNEIEVPLRASSDKDVVEAIAERYSEICQRPPMMFAEDGAPLPPTFQEEASAAEREARKEYIKVREHGSIPQSVLKTTVLLESRTASWKRIGNVREEDSSTRPGPTKSTSINPWVFKLDHSSLDVNSLTYKPIRKQFEITRSKRVGLCEQCNGEGIETCRRCQASEADECWWCKGTSKGTSSSPCKQCQGTGVLACQKCHGSHTQACTPCHGKGTGVFVVMLQVCLSKHDLDPLPVADIGKDKHEDWLATQIAYKERARENVAQFMQSVNMPKSRRGSQMSDVQGKKASPPVLHRPFQVLCQLTHSKTHLIELEVPQAAKVIRTSKSTTSLRSVNVFQRKIPRASSYFLLPSDTEFGPLRISQSDLKLALGQQPSDTKGKGRAP